MFELRQSFLLFITATIWGSGFIGQSIGMDHVAPFTFTFFRTLIGALVLLPVIFWLKKRAKRHHQVQKAPNRKALIMGSLVCGTCLISAESFQQFGLVYTEASKAGFITSMYIIFVPFLSWIFGRRPNLLVLIATLLSAVGLYLLCIEDPSSLHLQTGDLLILICALVFAVHILAIAHYVEQVDGVELSCGQFFVASFLGLITMLLFDKNLTFDNIMAAAPAMLWCGVMSNGVAYALQIVGQRGINPTIATIILSLESVMAVFFGYLILDESLNGRQYVGCAIMLAAVIIAQLNPRLILRLIGRS